ncbi:MAG: hypothetical protein H5T72_02405 [Actinobacteria bacterium]|nr:hypothetical protein [Actinomycetota bacterium]
MSGEGESTAQVFVAAWLVTMLWKGYISDASRHGHGFSEKAGDGDGVVISPFAIYIK